MAAKFIWDVEQYGPMSEATIRERHQPAGHFRVSRFSYPVGARFTGTMRRWTCYLMKGHCTYDFGEPLELDAGEVAELPGGDYEFVVLGTEEAELVLVWELPEVPRQALVRPGRPASWTSPPRSPPLSNRPSEPRYRRTLWFHSAFADHVLGRNCSESMEFREPTNPKEVVEAFYDNWIPWVDVPRLLLPFITEQNVDTTLGELPEELRDYFVEYAEANLVRDDHPGLVISPSGRPPVEPPREAVLAVRGWLARRR